MCKKFLALGVFVSFGLLMTSCEKDKKEEEKENQETESNEQLGGPFLPGDCDIALAAMTLNSEDLPFPANSGISYFVENTGDSTGVYAADSVNLENILLDTLSDSENGTFYYHLGFDLILGDTLNWKVVANDNYWLQNFTHKEANRIPEEFQIIADTTVQSSSEYTMSILTWSGMALAADTIRYSMEDEQGNSVEIGTTSDVQTVTFDKNQVDQLNNGRIFIDVSAAVIRSYSVLNNKKLCTVNQQSTQIYVTKK